MKIINKLLVLCFAALLPMTFAGCSDDNGDVSIGEDGETPDFVIEQEYVKVKIGAENKATINVKEGGGEYDVFVLNSQVAKVEMVNGVIEIEGLSNGKTSVVVSDKYSRFRRVPISVYTTDKLELSHMTFDMFIFKNRTSLQMLNVKLGNGEYKATSDNPDLTVKANDAGEIVLTATLKEEPFTANVTVVDCIGLTATIAVTIKEGTKPFVDEELKVFMTDKNSKFYLNEADTYDTYYELVNENISEGKQRYGWNYYDYEYLFIDFAGGKEVGKKNDASLTYMSWYGTPMEGQPITCEIIKNDGTNIWGIFSYINEEDKLCCGHFCTVL